MTKINHDKFVQILKNFYTESGPEIVGFIYGNKVEQVRNISEDPENGFLVSGEDFIDYVENKKSWASWHTHPNASSNLSGDDYSMFKLVPHLTHYIIGNDGVRGYQYDKQRNAVVEVVYG